MPSLSFGRQYLCTDIDRDAFPQLVDAIASAAASIALYTSSRDQARRASKLVHGHARAGDRDNIAVHAHVLSIDASAVDTHFLGHGDFSDTGSVASDIYYVIRAQGRPRAGLQEKNGPAAPIARSLRDAAAEKGITDGVGPEPIHELRWYLARGKNQDFLSKESAI